MSGLLGRHVRGHLSGKSPALASCLFVEIAALPQSTSGNIWSHRDPYQDWARLLRFLSPLTISDNDRGSVVALLVASNAHRHDGITDRRAVFPVASAVVAVFGTCDTKRRF